MKIKIPDVWSIEYEEFLPAFNTSLVFRDWMDENTEDRLLEKYGITPGELYTKTTNAEWLLYAGKEMAIILNNVDAANHLNKLRLRMRYGIRAELLELIALQGIGRMRARMLWENGLRKTTDIKNAGPRLEKLLGAKLARQVLDQINEDKYDKFARIKSRR